MSIFQYTKNWNLKKKKRTAPTKNQKEKNIECLETLLGNKTEVATVQKNCWDVDLQIKTQEKEQKKLKWKKEEELLDLEIKIKKEQLNEVIAEKKRKQDLHAILLENEKIKTDILKCELNIKLRQH